jgi:MFS transporter, ACS family, solute carrier family 17 (sodium-dependent inorganic phosphate cotransporter), member 6/7/8
MVWYVVWLWLTFEKPRNHPTISAGELIYIEQSIGAGATSAVPMLTIHTTPWKEFFTSMPVYAIIVANVCRSWNFYFLVLFQAAYLQTFHLKITEVIYVDIRKMAQNVRTVNKIFYFLRYLFKLSQI